MMTWGNEGNAKGPIIIISMHRSALICASAANLLRALALILCSSHFLLLLLLCASHFDSRNASDVGQNAYSTVSSLLLLFDWQFSEETHTQPFGMTSFVLVCKCLLPLPLVPITVIRSLEFHLDLSHFHVESFAILSFISPISRIHLLTNQIKNPAHILFVLHRNGCLSFYLFQFASRMTKA